MELLEEQVEENIARITAQKQTNSLLREAVHKEKTLTQETTDLFYCFEEPNGYYKNLITPYQLHEDHDTRLGTLADALSVVDVTTRADKNEITYLERQIDGTKTVAGAAFGKNTGMLLGKVAMFHKKMHLRSYRAAPPIVDELIASKLTEHLESNRRYSIQNHLLTLGTGAFFAAATGGNIPATLFTTAVMGSYTSYFGTQVMKQSYYRGSYDLIKSKSQRVDNFINKHLSDEQITD